MSQPSGDKSAVNGTNHSQLGERHAQLYNEINSAFFGMKSCFDHFTRAYVEYSRFLSENAQQLGLPSAPPFPSFPSLPSVLNPGPLNTSAAAAQPAAQPDGRKKYKKREPRDPNAPKRPLTAYFLFLKAARPHIKQDLEEQTNKPISLNAKVVSEEATKRFKELSEEERAAWDNLYQKNLRIYKKAMREYSEKNNIHKYNEEFSDATNLDDGNDGPDAQTNGTAQNTTAATAGASAATNDQSNNSDKDAEGESDVEPSSTKTKTNPPKSAQSEDTLNSKPATSKPATPASTATSVPKPKQTPVPLPSVDKIKAPESQPATDGTNDYNIPNAKAPESQPAVDVANDDNIPIDPRILAEEKSKERKRKTDGKEQSPEQPKKKKKKNKDGIEASSQTVAASSPVPDGRSESKGEGKEGKKKKKKSHGVHDNAVQSSEA